MVSTTEQIDDLPSKAKDYLYDVLSVIDSEEPSVTSIIAVGSVVKGGFSNAVSDVDIIVVLADLVPKKIKRFLDKELRSLEYKHGFRKHPKSILETVYMLADELAGMYLSHFVCYKDELLAGNSARVFNLHPLLSFFTPATRIPFANIVVSGKTIWGEDILKHIKILPISRFQLIFGGVLYLNNTFNAIVAFPIFPNATKYAMETLKWSLHSCYFCYNLKAATVEEEVGFFVSILGEQLVFTELMLLRKEYKKSFGFVVRCFPMIIKLYNKTLREISFPTGINSNKSDIVPTQLSTKG